MLSPGAFRNENNTHSISEEYAQTVVIKGGYLRDTAESFGILKQNSACVRLIHEVGREIS